MIDYLLKLLDKLGHNSRRDQLLVVAHGEAQVAVHGRHTDQQVRPGPLVHIRRSHVALSDSHVRHVRVPHGPDVAYLEVELVVRVAHLRIGHDHIEHPVHEDHHVNVCISCASLVQTDRLFLGESPHGAQLQPVVAVVQESLILRDVHAHLGVGHAEFVAQAAHQTKLKLADRYVVHLVLGVQVFEC